MEGGMSCQLFQSHVFYILFPFQDPQESHSLQPAKKSRLATISGGPSPAPVCGELEETITWSLTDEEEHLNLVSPLLTSKVTMSVLITAWH